MSAPLIRNLATLVLIASSHLAAAQAINLSPQAEISIITCGPSQSEVFTAFGHTAIRVVDPVARIDYAYNYGVFDFNQPNFYLNFARGIPYYMLGVYSYPDFREAYIYYNRSLTEQVLDLSLNQKQTIFNFLEWNALPENKNYRYDYFYDNCATRVRDVFANALKDSIQFDGSYIHTEYTIRQLTDLYLQQQPWGDLGIDICLGLPMDKPASPYEYMFLPDYIESGFDHVTITKSGNKLPLVKSKQVIYVARPETSPTSWPHPWIILGAFLLATVALSLYDLRRNKLSKWFDLIIFGVAGAIGILLLLLWTMTGHKAAANNLNILWALPSHLIIVMILRKNSAAFVRRYFLAFSALAALLLLTWAFLPQQLHVFLIPFVAALMVRSYLISKLL